MGTAIAEQDLDSLISEAAKGEKYPLARIISEIEKPNSFGFRKTLFTRLNGLGLKERDCRTIGFTGTPGAGKSSLLGEISKRFLKETQEQRMAIVAIDPSSSLSGGSILGDRTRLSIPARESRIYFRSQPSQLELGGVNPYTYHVIRLLRFFFDLVFVETVGIGQNEVEVSRLTDYSFLVLQPLGGDQIQFMKSGIMEVPNAFIINKYDEEKLARASFHMLRSTLEFMKEISASGNLCPIFKTSVLNQTGIDELFRFLQDIPKGREKPAETKEQILKWTKSEFGSFGIRKLNDISLDFNLPFEELEERIQKYVLDNVSHKRE